MDKSNPPNGENNALSKYSRRRELFRLLIVYPAYYGIGFALATVAISVSRGNRFVGMSAEWAFSTLAFLIFISIVVSYSIHFRDIAALFQNRFSSGE